MNSVMLSTPLILILSLVALFLMLLCYAVKSEKLSDAMLIAGFLCVLAAVVYGVLLGAGADELLIYVLVFVLVSLVRYGGIRSGGGDEL